MGCRHIPDPLYFLDFRSINLIWSKLVTYRYAPGDDLDGATVHIPLPVLNRVEPWDFDWQVPGYRRDLVLALVATLPKAVRRQLPPLGEAAARAAAALSVQPRPLVEALADVLTQQTGVAVRADDLDPLQVPAHLRLTFAVDEGDTVLAFGKDLDAVWALVGGRARRAIAALCPGVERSGLTRWDGGDLPRVVRATVDGHVVEGYPALLDDGDSVAVKIFTRPEVADRVMVVGLRRLVLLSVPVGVRGLEREVPDEVRLALASVPDLSLGGLLRDVIAAAAGAIVTEHGGPTWTEAGITSLLDRARVDLRPLASRALHDAGAVVVAAADVLARVERLGAPSLARSIGDASSHLRRLVRSGFVATAGTARLPDVLRYVQGIAKRLERLAEAPHKDEVHMAEVAGVERLYGDLLDALAPSQVTPRVVAAGWMLEELRVSLFAQTVGTRVPVSTKRIRAEIDQLFAGHLD